MNSIHRDRLLIAAANDNGARGAIRAGREAGKDQSTLQLWLQTGGRIPLGAPDGLLGAVSIISNQQLDAGLLRGMRQTLVTN